ncbi:MAG: protein kinase, partial [Propionibacterium sp.]|nr:protein kinase [Propionibacterium sp.]
MTRDSTSDPLVGDVLAGRYEIVRKLARGGMATVYRARDRRLGRVVAVKVMHEGLGDDADFARKFDREARAVARLSDPHVVGVFDQGRDHGRPYIVMEFVEGCTLRNLITREAPFSPARALELIEPVVGAAAAPPPHNTPIPDIKKQHKQRG